jgi:hypothetical protein
VDPVTLFPLHVPDHPQSVRRSAADYFLIGHNSDSGSLSMLLLGTLKGFGLLEGVACAGDGSRGFVALF